MIFEQLSLPNVTPSINDQFDCVHPHPSPSSDEQYNLKLRYFVLFQLLVFPLHLLL